MKDTSTALTLVAPVSWAAGVLDLVGVFELRTESHRGAVRLVGSRVESGRLPLGAAEVLRDILGGRTRSDAFGGHYWTCPAEQQQEVLTRLLPHLRLRTRAATGILQYRLTVGAGDDPQVVAFRRLLLAPGVERAPGALEATP